jgi:hypothetical protein
MWHSILCHESSYVWDLVPAHLVIMFAPGFLTPKIQVWHSGSKLSSVWPYIVASLWCSTWTECTEGVGVAHAFLTSSWNPESLVQKFSKRNGHGRRGPVRLERSKGHWSEIEVASACRPWESKERSQLSLQKTMSSLTKVRRLRSLLQVNFRFCRWI